jgi:hypothetical protein
VTVQFDAYDSDSEAQISLFYDTDDQGLDGHLFAQGVAETDGSGSYVWDSRGVTDGTYYLYARIDDGANVPRFSYATSPVTLVSPGIEGHVFIDTDGDGVWDPTEVGKVGVSVFLDLDRDGLYSVDEPKTNTMFEDPMNAVHKRGFYGFYGLDYGDYLVRQIVNSPYAQSYPGGDAGREVSVVGDTPVCAVDFGIHSELQNLRNHRDVNDDGYVTPIDALLVINWLNWVTPDYWPDPAPPFRDVNGDLRVTPLDSLLVINELNFQYGGEGESQADRTAMAGRRSVQEPSTTTRMTDLDHPGAVDEDLCELLAKGWCDWLTSRTLRRKRELGR